MPLRHQAEVCNQVGNRSRLLAFSTDRDILFNRDQQQSHIMDLTYINTIRTHIHLVQSMFRK
jgi:hypothetical protein